MILNNSSKVINIQNIGISEEEKEKIYIPKSVLSTERLLSLGNLVTINNEIYYIKTDNIINELIGSFLAKKIKLDSVDYQIGIYNNNIYTLSKLFYDRDYNYFYPKDYKKFKTNSPKINELYWFKSKLNQFNNNLKDELLKLIALDLKMGQTDRHGHNLMLKENIKTGYVDLAPIYDYSFCYSFFGFPFKYYKNVYFFMRFNYFSILRLTKKHPKIMEYIDILKEIDMEEILEAIEKEKNIEIEPNEKIYRLDRDNEYTKILKSI